MLLRENETFYVEHGTTRRGYYNARHSVFDAGQADRKKERVYRAEHISEKKFRASTVFIKTHPLKRYVVASIIDHIVTQPEYVEWFGATHLLVLFNRRRSRSRAWAGCVEFADHPSCGLAWFDIYHELAHHVTIRTTEPHHGERFIGALLLIASLSPNPEHAVKLASALDTVGLYPTGNYIENQLTV